jgi:hypothetical protein
MPFTPSLIGRVNFSNVTQATLPTGNIAIGSKILVSVCLNEPDWDDVVDDLSTDTTGNIYFERAGSVHPNGTVGCWFVECPSTVLRLRPANNIILTRAGGMTGSLAAFSVTGLTAGLLDGSSAGYGTSVAPVAALAAVPANDIAAGIVGVAGPSSDGFTQDPAFLSPGNFNTQTTTNFSSYGGYHQQAALGDIAYRPTLGVSRDWVALLLAVTP